MRGRGCAILPLKQHESAREGGSKPKKQTQKTNNMKKFAMMLAAGVVAFGASAQAASVESTTYAVITVPIASGYNFIGAGVTPLDGTADTFAQILGVGGDTAVKVYTGSGYSSTTAGQVTADLGTAVFYDNTNGEASTIYEIGVASSEASSAIVDLSTGAGTYTLVSSPFAAAWSPDDATSLESNSFNRFGTKANQIHIWVNGAWQTWWYKTGTGWKCKTATITDQPTIGAGQAVLVQKGSANSATTLTFAAPQ